MFPSTVISQPERCTSALALATPSIDWPLLEGLHVDPLLEVHRHIAADGQTPAASVGATVYEAGEHAFGRNELARDLTSFTELSPLLLAVALTVTWFWIRMS